MRLSRFNEYYCLMFYIISLKNVIDLFSFSISKCSSYKGCCPGSSWNSTAQQCESTHFFCNWLTTHFQLISYDKWILNELTIILIDDYMDNKHITIGFFVFFIQIWLVKQINRLTFSNYFLECMPGYSGENCTSLCPYPQYGVDCQRTCNCSIYLCNVSTGCISPPTGKHMKKNILSQNPL